MRRSDLFLALRDEHEVDRQLLPRPMDRVERSEECGLWPLLIHRAAADEDLPESGSIDERGTERWRRPLQGVGLLHVVHEVDSDRLRGTRVERGEDAWVTIGLDTRGLLKARVARESHHEIAALVHAAVLRGEGRVLHPLLKAFDAFVVTFLDLGRDVPHRRIGEKRLSRRLSHGWLARREVTSPPSDARSATSPMITASSVGRDHIGQWLVGRSTYVTLRSSFSPPSQAWPSFTASLYCADVYPVQMTVLGTSRRASLVSSALPRSAAPGSETARRRNVSSCSLLSPLTFSSAASFSSEGIGFSTAEKSGSSAPFAGPVST